METAALVIQLYLVVVVLDVVLAWFQVDPTRPPRRFTHALTEPPQAVLRPLLSRLPTGGWDISPLVVMAILGVIRVRLLLP